MENIDYGSREWVLLFCFVLCGSRLMAFSLWDWISKTLSSSPVAQHSWACPGDWKCPGISFFTGAADRFLKKISWLWQCLLERKNKHMRNGLLWHKIFREGLPDLIAFGKPFLVAFLKWHAVFLNELDFSSFTAWRIKRRWTDLEEEVNWSSCSNMEAPQKS